MAAAADRKVVVVTRRTRLDDLLARFHTREQARFYVEHLGADFGDYEQEDATYRAARAAVAAALEGRYRHQFVDRQYLPNFLFGDDDVVVALGQDGLVANTMKYLDGHPLVGLNPDPARWDGVLLPFHARDLAALLPGVLEDKRQERAVTMAQVSLSDGQELQAVNDLFIGPRSHTSLRYEIEADGDREVQSSSGLIISTGLGSTGWLRSIVTGSTAVAGMLGGVPGNNDMRAIPWDARELIYVVREPFPSRTTQVALVCGVLRGEQRLKVRSLTPENGVIFSDGVEADYLQFNAGTVAEVGVAARRGRLLV